MSVYKKIKEFSELAAKISFCDITFVKLCVNLYMYGIFYVLGCFCILGTGLNSL